MLTDDATARFAIRRVRRALDDVGASLVGRKVLVMCSGGIDSTVLVALLGQLPRGAAPRSIDVLWLDHALRPSVDLERAAARHGAEWIGAQFHERRASDVDLVGGGGTHACARTWRYATAAIIARDLHCDVVLTGHTASDQLEHTLLAMTGVIGDGSPTSMVSARLLGPGLQLVRPLLPLTRTQIESIASELGVEWAEDPTNADEQAGVRNAVRHRVVPALLDAHPTAGPAIARAAAREREAREIREQLAVELLAAWNATPSRLDVRNLARLASPTRRAVLSTWLRGGGAGRALTTRLVLATERLALAPGRAACMSLDLPDGARVRRDGYHLNHHPSPRHGGTQP